MNANSLTLGSSKNTAAQQEFMIRIQITPVLQGYRLKFSSRTTMRDYDCQVGDNLVLAPVFPKFWGSSAYQKRPTYSCHLSQKFSEATTVDLTHLKFENRSKTARPDSSNHSLYLIKLFNSSYPEGNFGRNQPRTTNDLHVSTQGFLKFLSSMFLLLFLPPSPRCVQPMRCTDLDGGASPASIQHQCDWATVVDSVVATSLSEVVHNALLQTKKTLGRLCCPMVQNIRDSQIQTTMEISTV